MDRGEEHRVGQAAVGDLIAVAVRDLLDKAVAFQSPQVVAVTASGCRPRSCAVNRRRSRLMNPLVCSLNIGSAASSARLRGSPIRSPVIRVPVGVLRGRPDRTVEKSDPPAWQGHFPRYDPPVTSSDGASGLCPRTRAASTRSFQCSTQFRRRPKQTDLTDPPAPARPVPPGRTDHRSGHTGCPRPTTHPQDQLSNFKINNVSVVHPGSATARRETVEVIREDSATVGVPRGVGAVRLGEQRAEDDHVPGLQVVLEGRVGPAAVEDSLQYAVDLGAHGQSGR